MSQYEKLDQLIMNKIGNYPQKLSGIYCRDVREECDRIADLAGRESFRVCDGRLQALRKSGKIEYKYGGWRKHKGEPA